MQYIFFDVDGVLIQGYHIRPELRVCWDENLTADFGIDRQRFTDEFVFGPSFHEVIVGKKDLREALAAALPLLGCDADPQVFADYWLEKDSNINRPLLDKVKALKASGQVRLFIATNQAHDRARYLMDKLGFGEVFEDIFHSARVGTPKPERAYFQYVSDALRLPAHPKPIFFDDRPAVVSAAREFGWDAFEFLDVTSLDQSKVVSSLLAKAA
jgi:putative hydrolase of the HAD superfamily